MARTIFIALAALVLISGGLTFLLRPSNTPTPSFILPPHRATLQDGNPISVTGTITCLPHRATEGAVTLECAIGLLGDDSYHYGILGASGAYSTMNGQAVTISGAWNPADGSEKYDIIGNITVSERSPTSGAGNGSATVKGGCAVGGCSGQLCGEAEDTDDLVSTCEFRPEYACYQRFGTCERQVNGVCGWTDTFELASCLHSPETI